MRPYHIVISCEHAGNQVPKAFAYLFNPNDKVLETHRGWDPGALDIALEFSEELKAKLFETSVTRLLVDCNRSRKNREVFSEYSMKLKESVREYLLEQYYLPYRKKVEAYIANHCKKSPVLHLSMHTFTPIWHGQERLVDVGILFDEDRVEENALGSAWKRQMQQLVGDKTIMINVPYNGADDGFTSYLRRKFEPHQYLGFEIEINQKWVGTSDLESINSGLIAALRQSIDQMKSKPVA